MSFSRLITTARHLATCTIWICQKSPGMRRKSPAMLPRVPLESHFSCLCRDWSLRRDTSPLAQYEYVKRALECVQRALQCFCVFRDVYIASRNRDKYYIAICVSQYVSRYRDIHTYIQQTQYILHNMPRYILYRNVCRDIFCNIYCVAISRLISHALARAMYVSISQRNIYCKTCSDTYCDIICIVTYFAVYIAYTLQNMSRFNALSHTYIHGRIMQQTRYTLQNMSRFNALSHTYIHARIMQQTRYTLQNMSRYIYRIYTAKYVTIHICIVTYFAVYIASVAWFVRVCMCERER